jgi:hypothetical protein
MSKPPVDPALDWLRLVKAGTPAQLVNATALPFTFASTAKKAACAGTFRTEAALESWVGCTRKEQAAWLAELDVEGEPPPLEGGKDSAKLAALMKKVAPRAAGWIRRSMVRDGVAYTFRFVMDPRESGPRVSAFLLDVADGG